ncbi:MAG: TonB-dependent receptor, partial [Crocinitomicaceae bacterium]|nr:TonB-dependent receptor [Crocinitomicaceae bacterium]
MVKLYCTIIFILFSIVLFGQEFTGTVKDELTNETIAFAKVYFSDMNSGTITDENGVFYLSNYPNKKTSIQISYLGYKTKTLEINFSEIKEMTFFLEISHLTLQEVVVSVPGGKLQNENIVSVDRKKIEELKETSPLTLSEAISTIPGVEQRTTGAGIGKPIIRGLSGNRIVTYAQGMRIENQQWGDEHGLGIGDVGIESVEVIKGPASLLYGSDALGGVLYFVDERYAKQNYIEGFIQTNFQSNTLGTLNNLGLKIHKNKLKWNLFGTYISNADYQIPNGERVYNTRFEEKNFKTSFGYSKKNWISNLRYSFLQDRFGITEEDSIYSSSKERVSTLPFQTIDNHNLSWDNTIFTRDSKLNMVLGYTGNRRKEFEDDAN